MSSNINKSKVVPYPQHQMYTLVNDIGSYSEFVPFCSDSRIDNYTHEEICATLSFAQGRLRKSFTTLNRLQPYKIIEIRLINGPFRRLEGYWYFESVDGNRCRVSLNLEFEFSSQWLSFMFEPLFKQVATMLVDTFYKQANFLYGNDHD